MGALETIHTATSPWRSYRLREIATKIQDGTHFSPKLGGSKYRYITSKNIGPGYLKLDSVEMISESEHRKIYQRCDVKRGDLLLTKDGANTGNTAISTFEDEVSLLSSVAFIRTNRAVALERYVLHYFLSDPGRRQIEDAMTGNAITRLTLEKINNLVIPLPPIKEQTEAADVLDEVDSLIISLELLIAKKHSIKQGMMQQLLNAKTRLPGFTGSWDEVLAGDIGSFRGGNGFPLRFQGLKSGKYPFYKVSDMNTDGNHLFMDAANNYMSEAKIKQIGAVIMPKDAIVFAKVGAAVFLERKRILTKPSCIDNNMAAFAVHPERGDVRFIHYVLSQFPMSSLAATGALPSLNGRQLRSIPIYLPSSLNEQRAIAQILMDADAEIEGLNTRLSKAKEINQGMMQELLTGRTRLPFVESAS